MIDKVVNQWHEKNENLREWLEDNKPGSYKNLLKKTIELVVDGPIRNSYSAELDIENLEVIDHGHYQGTQIFLIPTENYQPNEKDYVWLHNYYGSCSGCDTFESIRMKGDWDSKTPNEEQVDDYMKLALHMIQRMKWLDNSD